MMTIDITKESCSYYDPCGGSDCQECNATRGVPHTVLPNPFALFDRLCRLNMLVQPQGICSPSGGSELKAGIDSTLKSLSFETAVGGKCDPLIEGSGFEQSDPVSGGRAMGETPFRRSVKEVKRKRRQNAREGGRIGREKPEEGNRYGNKFGILEDISLEEIEKEREEKERVAADGGCKKRDKLRIQAINMASLLSQDLAIPCVLDDLRSNLTSIECGELKSAVRGCFGLLSTVQELSIKTSMKVEIGYCKPCKESKLKNALNDWKDKLERPVTVRPEALERFSRLFRMNVPKGWDRSRKAYIPNGAATLGFPIKDGGNWNKEEFSPICRAVPIVSSGKVRVVTCYAEENVRVLTPLHASLYGELEKKGWLLVGEPEGYEIDGLTGEGDYQSFDYSSATDSLKREYVNAAIDILIDSADSLSDMESRCLRVLGSLKVADPDALIPRDCSDEDLLINCPARGQPMGSPMSFPLLCLINKTLVDMSLTDLLEQGKIGFEQWCHHTCKINGDDLILREPLKKTLLRARIEENGREIGLEVNLSKSKESPTEGEVNSTCFEKTGSFRFQKLKKTNASALYMKPNVCDVLGYAHHSTTTIKGFMRIVRHNRGLLSRQVDKRLGYLPFPYVAALRKCRSTKSALLVAPEQKGRLDENLMPIVKLPHGYELPEEEVREVLEAEVSRVRNNAISLAFKQAERKHFHNRKKGGFFSDENWIPSPKSIGKVSPHNLSWRTLLKRKKGNEESIMRCLADRFYYKIQKELLESEKSDWTTLSDSVMSNRDESLYESKIDYLMDALKSSKKTKEKFLCDGVEYNSEKDFWDFSILVSAINTPKVE